MIVCDGCKKELKEYVDEYWEVTKHGRLTESELTRCVIVHMCSDCMKNKQKA